MNTSISQIISVLCALTMTATTAQGGNGAKAQPVATALSRAESAAMLKGLWDAHVKTMLPAVRDEWERKVVQGDGHSMKFEYRIYGVKPKQGWDLYLSFHGGGSTTAQVNDSQWKNQIQLYTPKQGIYVAPRAPTDSWNMWHQEHIDGLLARLIEGAVIHMGANPERVYIMGYSAGGDGVYQLAPRIADRLAAAAMMAGHPNETSPLGLRNIGFAIHVGELDSGYNRNQVAAEWAQKLAVLHAADPAGYRHVVKLHKGLGHWMNREDAVALEWMAQFTREPCPQKVVWKQDDVTHTQFYWLSVSAEETRAGTEITAERKGQTILLSNITGIEEITILLSDSMLDLDQPIKVQWQDQTLFHGVVPRTRATLLRTLNNKHDPRLCFAAEVTVEIKGNCTMKRG
ncbi:MAG: alpha/beta hydrolase [Kiritimatiellae bacterium]|nr:alpha/beta hydrolase [Kiritimatiellia bacterium]